MTTINAASAWRASRQVSFAVFTAVLGVAFTALAGCSTTPNIFSGTGDNQNSAATGATQPLAGAQSSKIAIAPVIGAPESIASQLQSKLAASLQQRKIPVASNAAEAAAYTLRGYVVSARENSGTKVSYIWDVTDGAGQRVNRISGEEVAPASGGRDPWASVNDGVVSAIATKTAGSLAAWLPTQTKTGSQGAPAVAAANQKPGAAPLNTAAVPNSTPSQTTGSIARSGKVSAVVPGVVGAPGDGGVSLTNALQRQLTRNGIALASAATPDAYRVEGEVKVGPGSSGKQPIQIDWHVKDPLGKKLGTVSQKNDIPQGSLDGAWGKTADAAAAAAAQGILKLLPRPTSTN